MPLGWFREYRDAVAPRWLRWLLAISTVVGGVAGVYYLATEADVSPFVASLVVLLVASLILNLRQVLVWKREREAVRDASDMTERWRRQADQWKRTYEDEEQRWWTNKGLRVQTHNFNPRRLDAKPQLLVEVMSDTEIRPLWLRFWFSCEIEENPLPKTNRISGFIETRSGHTFDLEIPEESPAQVFPDGRVEVRWKDPAFLGPGSGLQVYVSPKSQEKEIRLLDVQRRHLVS